MRLFKGLAALVLAAACGTGGLAAGSIPHDPGFEGISLRWSTAGSTSVFYRLAERDGRMLVCGFWFSEGPVPDANAERLLIHSRIRAGRQTVMSNVSHFTRITPDTPPERVRAACKPSRRAWTPALAEAQVQLRPPIGSFD